MARILVVDDEATIRLTIRMALEFVHHQVETAADGEEALRRFGDGESWDLVLLDHRLPGLAGLAVLEWMRHQNPQARIMLITAFGTIDLAYQALRAGAVDFLRKPFTAETLRGAVEQALLTPVTASLRTGRFILATINGFRLQPVPPDGSDSGGVFHTYEIHSPTGAVRRCRVVLPQYLMTLVSEHTHQAAGLSQESWWQLLCEEVLANYVWQHSDFPPEELRIEELTSGLKRWIDAILAEAG